MLANLSGVFSEFLLHPFRNSMVGFFCSATSILTTSFITYFPQATQKYLKAFKPFSSQCSLLITLKTSEMFSGESKGNTGGEKGLELQETESIANIIKLRSNLYISIILYLIALKYFPYFNSLLLCFMEPFKSHPYHFTLSSVEESNIF